MRPKEADRIANRVDPDQTALDCASRSSLILNYTVCPGLSVQKLRILLFVAFRIFLSVANSYIHVHCASCERTILLVHLLDHSECSITKVAFFGVLNLSHAKHLADTRSFVLRVISQKKFAKKRKRTSLQTCIYRLKGSHNSLRIHFEYT